MIQLTNSHSCYGWCGGRRLFLKCDQQFRKRKLNIPKKSFSFLFRFSFFFKNKIKLREKFIFCPREPPLSTWLDSGIFPLFRFSFYAFFFFFFLFFSFMFLSCYRPPRFFVFCFYFFFTIIISPISERTPPSKSFLSGRHLKIRWIWIRPKWKSQSSWLERL